MFVELQYQFKSSLVNGFSRMTDHTISQVASMVVRGKCDLVDPLGNVGIFNIETSPVRHVRQYEP